MDTLQMLKNMLNEATDFVKVNSYYFHEHNCEKSGNIERVNLCYKIKNETTNDIVLFNICPNCKKIFYHEDYETQTL